MPMKRVTITGYPFETKKESQKKLDIEKQIGILIDEFFLKDDLRIYGISNNENIPEKRE